MTEPEWPTTGSASIRIAASPEAAYDYVTDLATLPTLSPENQRCEFIEGSTEIVEGALFRGFNENGGYEWSAECRVLEAERGRVFSFLVPPAWEYATTWTYRFEPDDDGLLETFFLLVWQSVASLLPLLPLVGFALLLASLSKVLFFLVSVIVDGFSTTMSPKLPFNSVSQLEPSVAEIGASCRNVMSICVSSPSSCCCL